MNALREMNRTQNSILFVTSRNAYYTCGEMRLIKNRAQVLFDYNNIRTDFLVWTRKRNEKAEKLWRGCSQEVFLYKKYNLFSRFYSKYRLRLAIDRKLKENHYQVIVISGSTVFPLIHHIKTKHPNTTVIADVHGAIEELIEFPQTGMQKILRKILFLVCKQNEKKWLPKFDGYWVVAKTLEQYLQQEYHIVNKCFIIPCAIRRQTICEETIRKDRENARKKYGLKDDETLFIYSGGTSPWQCIEESVELFQYIAQSMPNAKMLILSRDKEYLQKFVSGNIMIDSLGYEEVSHVLPAGDFAFMLRKKMVTNWVAYPNKFMEYVLAGLKVIASPNVPDVAEQIKQYQVGIIVNDMSDLRNNSEILEYVAHGEEKTTLQTTQKLLDDVCFESRLKIFVDEYFK